MITPKLRLTLTAARQIDEAKEDYTYPTLNKAYRAAIAAAKTDAIKEGIERYYNSLDLKKEKI